MEATEARIRIFYEMEYVIQNTNLDTSPLCATDSGARWNISAEA